MLIDFHVQQEDSVYPMVAPGAALNELIHAPHSAVAAPDGAIAQATIMFESTDRTAARVVALLGRQIGVLAVEEWNDDDSRR